MLHCQHIPCADPFSGCNFSCCRLFRRRVSDTLGLRFLHSPLPLVLMGIHNLVTSAIWIEVIVFMLLLHVIYLCYKSSSTVCVSIPIQGWHLSTEKWSIRVGSLQDGIRAHVDWQAQSKDFFYNFPFQKDLLPLFSSELIEKFPLVRPYPFPLLTTRRFDWWDHSKKYKTSDN